MQYRALIASLVLLAACGGQDGQDEDVRDDTPAVSERTAQVWTEDLYNWMPADDDLVIYGPCGARFTFRKVQTHTVDSWLANETVLLGQADAAGSQSHRALLEGVRQAPVVGAFTDDDSAANRFYYIGKYEVTQDQFAAVLGDTCPEPTPQGAMPVSNVSLFDAQRFMVVLNEWIYANEEATAQLPYADQTPAAVRLPSEAEWEFAARGGQNVSAEERIAPIYPMEDLEHRYEWYRSDESCAGSLQPIGYLEPNPLGLHDMLGNVREIVSDTFQLTAGRRYQGQVGTMMTKGGACDTPLEDLRSSARREYLEYDHEAGTLNRPDYVGFRLALGAPALPSNRRQQLYQDAFQELRLPRSARLADGSDPATELRALADGLTESEVIDRLEQIAGAIDAEMVERNTFETESAKALIATSASLIRNYRFARRDAASAGRAAENPAISEAQRPIFEQRAASAAASRDLSREFYAQLLIRAAEFEPSTFLEAARFTANESEGLYDIGDSGLSVPQMMCLFAAQVEDYRKNRPGDLNTYFETLSETTPASAPRCPAYD